MIKLPLAKVEKAASTDERRPVINGVWYDHEKRRLVAVDGYGAAIVPVESEDEERSFLVPLPVVKAARASRSSNRPLEGGRVFGAEGGVKVEVADLGEIVVPVDEVKLPDVGAFMKTWKVDGPKKAKVALSAELLDRVARAVCPPSRGGLKRRGIVLEVGEPDEPIIVRPLGYPDRIGVVMPLFSEHAEPLEVKKRRRQPSSARPLMALGRMRRRSKKRGRRKGRKA